MIRYLPGVVLGVFLARILGEAVGLSSVWIAVLLSGVLSIGFAWLLSRYTIAMTWPALILFAYVLYPEVSPSQLVAVAAVCLTSFGLQALFSGDRGPHNRLPALRNRTTGLTFGAVTIGFFALYLATLAPDVLAADGGELQVVAAQLGVAHPPGFPLYVILAHLVTRLLPFLPPAYAVNLFSAITSAVTVGVIYLTGMLITRRHLASLIAAIALGSATTFWAQSTTANVRSLTGLFTALILYTLIHFRIAIINEDKPVADRWLAVTALVMGFGVTHHVSLVFLIITGLVFILIVDRSLIRQPRRWWRPIGAGLLGLLPLLYLPLRAGAAVRGASPDLATLPGFLEHVLAIGFRGDLFYYTDAADFMTRLGIIGNILAFQFELILLAGMVAGFLLLLVRDRSLGWLLGGGFAIYTVIAATYRAPQTVEYMIPAYISACLILGYLTGWLLEKAEGTNGFTGAAAVLATSVIIVACLAQFPGHISGAGANHEAFSTRDYAGRLLDEAPPGSVILAHWHWATPLWYLQEVEGRRRDVEVRFVFPEGESYEDTWNRRTREEYATGRPVITTLIPLIAPDDLPTPEPLNEAILYPQEPRTSLPPEFTPVELTLGESIDVVGYYLDTTAVAPGDEVVVEVAWRPRLALPGGVTLFAHLVGRDGALYGQDDRPVAAAEGLTITQFRVTPRLTTPADLDELHIGVTIPPSSSASGATFRQPLSGIDVVERQHESYTGNPLYRSTVNDPAEILIGYDWDHTMPGRSRLYLHWRNGAGKYRTESVDDAAGAAIDLPAYRGPWGVPRSGWSFPRGQADGHYVPFGQGIVWTGESIAGISPEPEETFELRQVFHSSRGFNRDYVVSARLIGLEPDGFHWAWWDLRDSIPAMGAIPTLKWIENSLVRSPHQVTVQPQAVPGQALTGALTLYDAFTNRSLPILDERITASYTWVPLGEGAVGE